MAFYPSSRYAKLPTVEVKVDDTRTTSIVKLRRLPDETGDAIVVAEHDRLDIIAHERYAESTEYWHIADANTELDAKELEEAGRILEVPGK